MVNENTIEFEKRNQLELDAEKMCSSPLLVFRWYGKNLEYEYSKTLCSACCYNALIRYNYNLVVLA